MFQGLKSLEGPILVTGHTGFKGAWLSMLLNSLDIPMVGYSLPPELDSLYVRANLSGSTPEIFANILDKEKLRNVVQNYKPSVVLHLAAQPLVIKSYSNPTETFETNVIGTCNVIESSLFSSSVRSIGIVTTDKVYKNSENGVKFKEDDPLEGKDPYSASKVAAESVVKAWQNISKMNSSAPIITLRAGNVIGGGDMAENRLIPDLIRAIKNDGEIQIRNSNSTRPWQHVLDPLIGYLLSIEKSLVTKESDVYNFGPMEKSLSVSQVASKALHYWPTLNLKIDSLQNSISREFGSLDLDSTKAFEQLSWTPARSQFQAIDNTFKWWHENINYNADPYELCSRDISFQLNSMK